MKSERPKKIPLIGGWGLRQGQSFEERRNWVTESPNFRGVTRKRKEISQKS